MRAKRKTIFKIFQVGVTRAVSVLRPILNSEYTENIENVGVNPGHENNLNIVNEMAPKRKYSFIKALRAITRKRNLGINLSNKLLPKEGKKSKSNSKPKNMAENKSRFSSGASNKVPVLAWVN